MTRFSVPFAVRNRFCVKAAQNAAPNAACALQSGFSAGSARGAPTGVNGFAGMDQFVIFLFALTSGFAASGATANLYRLFGFRAQTRAGRALRLSVLVIAGPSVIFESAVKGLKAGEWKPIGFWLTMALLFYWSLAIGMFVMELSMGLAADYNGAR